MSALLVTYDLNNPGQNYENLLKIIKSYDWIKLSESSYAIASEEEPQDVYKKIQSYIDKTDRIVIVALNLPWWGYVVDNSVRVWLNTHLQQDNH